MRPFSRSATAAVLLCVAASSGVRADQTLPLPVAAVRQALTQRYQTLDDAYQSLDAKALFSVLDTIYTPDFIARDSKGKVVPQDEWQAKVLDDATLGGQIRLSTGGFRIVDSQQVRYETAIDKLTVTGKTATAEVRRRRLVSTVGRDVAGGPRQRTDEVWSTEDRDGWIQTPQGWRLQTTQIVKMYAISSIGFVDPPAPTAK